LESEHLPPPALPTREGISSRSTLIKRSSSAQAPTRAKLRAADPPTYPPRGNHHDGHPPSSPSRPPRRPHIDLLKIILEEGDPDMDCIPISGPYASMVPPTSPWNKLGRDMIGVHTPSGSVISPTLVSPKRYNWLHAAHSQRTRPEAFTHDLLLKFLARYRTI